MVEFIVVIDEIDFVFLFFVGYWWAAANAPQREENEDKNQLIHEQQVGAAES